MRPERGSVSEDELTSMANEDRAIPWSQFRAAKRRKHDNFRVSGLEVDGSIMPIIMKRFSKYELLEEAGVNILPFL